MKGERRLGRHNFQVHMFMVAIDTLTQSLGRSLKAYSHLCSLFSVLFCAKSKPNASVIEMAMVLAFVYPSDQMAVYIMNVFSLDHL